MNLPTWITVSRLLGAPIILYGLHQSGQVWQWISLVVFLLAAATDWLDGYLARRLNQITDLGKFLDPLVDKLLVMAPLLALVERGTVPAWGVFLILARELTIAGWRVSPALQSGNAIQGANQWGKLKTISQMAAIALLIAPVSEPGQHWGVILFWVSVGLTWVSGMIYLWPTTTL
ncbi:MAG: CDP-diacylglycerol--glycerol-3-phosphate 3-phosphatidyltransferase [Leptolyngbyaceae cyanobacterium]